MNIQRKEFETEQRTLHEAAQIVEIVFREFQAEDERKACLVEFLSGHELVARGAAWKLVRSPQYW